ncbi:MAG: serine hydrolase [Aeromonadales bacterium]|nr:serine hydrolase [Aeromonadales bacterium]
MNSKVSPLQKYSRAALAVLLGCALWETAQASEEFLSAKDSDPYRLGWMQGFPPKPEQLLKSADGSFFTFPGLRYSVSHMREFMPTTNVSRGIGAPSPLPKQQDDAIGELEFVPWNATEPMTIFDSLDANYTDGFLVLHNGKIVFEHYAGALAEDKKHAAMSVTKSFTGTLAAMLVAEGRLDEEALVTTYVPELKDSAFGDATVRQLMDMTTGLQYSEDYADPNAEVWEYSAAGSPWPKPDDYKGPEGYFEYLTQVKKHGEHGEAFGYKTINSDALGWVIARATNQSVDELLSEKIWRRLGMEQDAYYQVDSLGTPFAGGGLSAGLRDMGRFGELIRNQGQWQGEQIIPAAAIADIQQGGNPEDFAKAGYDKLTGWSYRNMWWVTHNANGAFAARGVHGQTIYIDPTANMVLVRFASHPVAANGANDPTSLPAYQAIADYLITQSTEE